MENKDLIDALIQADSTLAICPQTTAVVVTRMLIEETLNKYELLENKL